MDLPSKIARLKALSGEVKEFHPLLHHLFQQLPNINHVQYTHGPNEKGADFILIKKDETLSRELIIGVVVKVGSIKSDNRDIREQIEECSLPRAINGKKEVQINEIWVVNNGNITNNAKDKFIHFYKDKNVQFIEGADVAQLIDSHYQEYWTDVSVELGNYFREILGKSDYLARSIDLLETSSITDLQIDQKFTNLSEVLHKARERDKPVKNYNLENVLQKEQLVLVQGSMGTGKSKLISNLTKQYCTNASFETTKTVPFSISFLNFVTKFNSDIEAVKALIKEKVKVEDVHYLIMIDGLDELKESNQNKLERLKAIYQSVIADSYCKVIVTSRPFDDLNTDNKVEKYFTVLEFVPLTLSQIISIVENICSEGDVKNKLLKDLEKSHLFKVLPKTPISAIILAKLLKQDVKEIPSTMTDLYAKYSELVLGRWDIDRGLQSQKEYDTCVNVSANVAKYMLDNQLPQIAIKEFRDMFDEYVGARKLDINNDSVFQTLINNEEMFVKDSNRDSITFIHRTFAEYFYAYTMNRDNSAVISEEIYTLYWNNTYFFYFGINKDSKELVNALSDITFSSDEARIAHIFHSGNLLLAAYLTPYDFITNSVLSSYTEASRFFVQTINNELETPLLSLPKMHVLSIVAYGMATSYGYDFFMDILEERSLELVTNNNLFEDEKSMAELFLINTTLLYNNKFKAFDQMIGAYGKKIPLMFQIGIRQFVEIKKTGTHTPVVKRYIKDFKKTAHKNIGIRQSAYKLFHEPIDKNCLPRK